jgi:hypothetical protein
VVLADGSIVQEHTGKAVDGLAPAGTISPLTGRSSDDVDDDDNRGATPRLGIIFNWAPTRILFVSEPFQNQIAALDLTDDGVVFRVSNVRHFSSEALDHPVDLAPVKIETADPNFSSNTTLDEGSDFYVANRGNNTIVRMTQDGTVVAVRRVRQADGRSLGNARLNGITTSPDGSTIFVTVTGRLAGQPQSAGAVLAMPSF